MTWLLFVIFAGVAALFAYWIGYTSGYTVGTISERERYLSFIRRERAAGRWAGGMSR